MEGITSRHSPVIRRLRETEALGENGELVLDGMKLLREAVSSGCELTCVLWDENRVGDAPCERQYIAPAELVSFASPVKNSPGPVFSVRIPEREYAAPPKDAIVLENVQDPGNVGTVIRTAAALGTGAVVLCGDCAGAYTSRCARASMGAVFRQRIEKCAVGELRGLLEGWGLPLIGAALGEESRDIAELPLGSSAVAVGNEGHGLSGELLSLCRDRLLIPMEPGAESLNAAVAAGIIMWEMRRQK